MFVCVAAEEGEPFSMSAYRVCAHVHRQMSKHSFEFVFINPTEDALIQEVVFCACVGVCD